MMVYLKLVQESDKANLDILVRTTDREPQNGQNMVSKKPGSLIHLGDSLLQRRELVWQRTVKVDIGVVLEVVARRGHGR